MATLEIDPYKISTITIVGYIFRNGLIDLQKFYDGIEILQGQYDQTNDDGFTFAEYMTEHDTFFKGFHKKKTIVRRKKVEKKRFDGFVSVLFSHVFNCKRFQINAKVFKNGNVQITGLKTIEQGHFVIDKLATYIKSRNEHDSCLDNQAVIGGGGLRVCLINSDFTIKYNGERATLVREKLYSLLQSKYQTFSEYDAIVHPSVRANFCYNSTYTNGQGVCECSTKCYGKGCGHGEGQCKKVTIAVFGSGCVIITGSQSITQLDSAYAFICKVIKENHQHFVKNALINKSNLKQPMMPVTLKNASVNGL